MKTAFSLVLSTLIFASPGTAAAQRFAAEILPASVRPSAPAPALAAVLSAASAKIEAAPAPLAQAIDPASNVVPASAPTAETAAPPRSPSAPTSTRPFKSLDAVARLDGRSFDQSNPNLREGDPVPAPAEAPSILGKHAGWGRNRKGDFVTSTEIRGNGGYVREKRLADGRTETTRGRARIVSDAIELMPEGGSAPELFRRRVAGGKVRWLSSRDDGEEVLTEFKKESFLALRIWRGPGLWNYLFGGNFGVADPSPGAEILRSRQPRPSRIDRLVARFGLKSILSLNGGRSVQAHGLEHRSVSLSARAAPPDADLVEIFRALLDDSLKPLLVHCRQGADRTGVVLALYEIEFMGLSKQQAKLNMRRHKWLGAFGTEIQGFYIDLYQPGTLRRLLAQAGVPIPERYRTPARLAASDGP